MNNSNGSIIFRNTVTVFMIVVLCIGVFSGCSEIKINKEKAICQKKDTLSNTEIIEAKYIGNELKTEFCDTIVAAVYDKTIHKSIGDITELRYRITSIERDGVAENVSENDYIGFDTKGNVISFTPKIYPGKLKCERVDSTYTLELSDGTKWQTDYSFFDSETTNELRVVIEKILGEVVDWSQYTHFSAKFDCPTYLDFYNFPYSVYNYMTFTWTQGGIYDNRRTDSVVSCTLYFATMDPDGEGHIFLDEAYFSDLVINEPFVEKELPSKYIENKNFGVILSPFSTHFEEMGYEVYSSERYFTIYNKKLCWVVIFKVQKGIDSTTYVAIYPLE